MADQQTLSPDDAIAALRNMSEDQQRQVLSQLDPQRRADILTKLTSSAPAAAPAAPKAPGTFDYHPPGTEPGAAPGSFADKVLRPIGNTGRAIARTPGDLYTAAKQAVTALPSQVTDFAHPIDAMRRSAGIQLVPDNDPALQGTTQSIAAPKVDYDRELPNLVGSAVGQTLLAEGAGGLIKGASNPAALKEGVRKLAQRTVGAGGKTVGAAVEGAVEDAGTAADRIRAQNKTATEGTLSDRGTVDDKRIAILQKDAADRADIDLQNQQLAAKHAQAIQDHANARNAAARTEEIRQQTIDQRQALTEEHTAAVEKAQRKAKAENDAAWAKWREKVGGATADMQPVVDTINAQYGANGVKPEDVGTFKQIMRDTAPSEDTPEGVSEVASLRNDIAKNYGSNNYDTLSPAGQEAVNRVVSQMGLGDMAEAPTGEGAEQVLKQIPASRLHDIKQKLEVAVRNTHGNVQYAVGRVLEAVRQREEAVSKSVGADVELKKARDLHGPYVDTFRNSPNEPQTVASKSLAETNPEFAKEASAQRRLAMQARYDETIPERAAKIKSLTATIEGLPSQAQTAAASAAQPPQPPAFKSYPPPSALPQYGEPRTNKPIEVPEVSIQQAREDLIRKNAAKWNDISQYKIRRLFTGALGALFGDHVGGHYGGAAGFAAAEMAPNMVANFALKPEVIEWLSKPTAEDIQTISKIPHLDRIKITDEIARQAIQAKRIGKQFKIAPAVAGLLGAAHMAQINNTQPQSPADLKKKASAVVQP